MKFQICIEIKETGEMRDNLNTFLLLFFASKNVLMFSIVYYKDIYDTNYV